MASLLPLIDGGMVKYKYPFALEYTQYTLLHEGEETTVKGKTRANKFIKENEGAEIVEQIDVLEPEENLYHLLSIAFEKVFKVCGNDKPIVFIGSKNNFREKLYPEYKANRKDAREPVYKDHAIAWLKKNFSFVECDGYEEDDGLAISHVKGKTCIICEDKDLLQIPGHQYNPFTGVKRNISVKEANYWLYTQILAGDATDNIPGIKGIGLKKAEKILEGSKSPKELYTRSLEAWGGDRDAMHLTAQLVYMLREEEDSFLKRAEVQA